jgi:hypothetical protein
MIRKCFAPILLLQHVNVTTKFFSAQLENVQIFAVVAVVGTMAFFLLLLSFVLLPTPLVFSFLFTLLFFVCLPVDFVLGGSTPT